ncbi:Pr6Pr family membrane protein [Donghicola sp.]|uniref:Pr6Pr family membrane protein n=1 Tax=Donghicola sp. TaxID=1929294 RepID=UPI0025FF4044|nr:Pr6Pr family membrane protein [Donghicola sp.]MCT4578067.1 Pr6Pr family membrane protein [Donghicola sp.]
MEHRLMWVIGAVAAISLVLQSYVNLIADGPEATLLSVWWNMLRYYTILTNLVVAAVFIMRPQFTAHWAGAITLQILLVGIVYHALLSSTHVPEGLLGEVANHGLHTVAPALVFLWWLIYAPKQGLGWPNPLWWVIWPLIYAAYGIWRGTLDGKYPYYFLNLPELGPIGLLREMSIVAAGFLIFGFVLLGIARVQRPSSSSK